MSETSRVYLDVDGVLNAVTQQAPAWGWGEPKRRKVNGWPITWAPELVEALNEVVRTPGVQVYWLTTWCHDAPSRLAPAIGLDGHDWPVVGFDHWRDSSPKVWWKLPAIQEHLDGFDGAVLWIDDDLTYDPAARAWLAGQPLVLGMSPNTGTGITRAEMETVRRFALATPDPSPAALDRTGADPDGLRWNPEHPAYCDGSEGCNAPLHVHGCFGETQDDCDDPSDHDLAPTSRPDVESPSVERGQS